MNTQIEISKTNQVILSYLNSPLSLKEQLNIIQQEFKQENQIYKALVTIIQASAYLENFEKVAGKAMSLLRKICKVIRWENFSNIRLQDCNLGGISFVDCNFKGSKMKNANIMYCWFIGCCLDNVVWDRMNNGEQRIFHLEVLAYNDTKIAQKNQQKNISLFDIKSGVELLTLKGTFSVPIKMKFLTHNWILTHEYQKTYSVIQILNANYQKTNSFIQIWNANTGKKIKNFDKIQTLDGLSQKGFIFSSKNQKYYLYHYRNERLLRQFKIREPSKGSTLRENCLLLAMKTIEHVFIWDFSLGNCILFIKNQNQQTEFAISHNGKQIALSNGQQIQLINIKERKLENTIKLYRVNKIVYSDDSQIIACQERNDPQRVYFFNSSSAQCIQIVSQFFHCYNFQNFYLQNDFIFYFDAKLLFLNKNSLCQTKKVINFQNKVQFGFISDGNQIAFFPEKGKAWLININNSKFQQIDNFKNLFLITYKAKLNITAMVFKGHLFTIQLFDFREKRKLSILKTKSKICSLDLSIDGNFLASGHQDFAIRIFDLTSLSQVNIFIGHQNNVICVVFSHDGSMLVSGSNDGTFLLWNIRKGEQIACFPKQESNEEIELFEDILMIMESDLYLDKSVNICAAFSYDSQILAFCNLNNIVLWNIETKQQIKVLKTKSHISMIAFQQDGLIVAKNRLSQLIFFTLETENLQCENVANNHCNNLAFSSDGRFLVAAGQDQIILYDVYYQRQMQKMMSHKSQIISIKVATQAKILASLDNNNFILIQDCDKNSLLKQITDLEQKIVSLALSSTGTLIAYGCLNGTICLWHILLMQQKIKINENKSQVISINFSLNELLVVAGCQDGSIFILNIQLENLKKILNVDSNSIYEVYFTNNDLQIGCLQADCFQAFYVGQTLELTRQLKHEGKFSSIALSPDQSSIALGETQGQISILNMKGRVIKELKIHEGKVKNVTFSFDGRLILSNCEQNILYLVRVADGTLVDKINWCNNIHQLAFLTKKLNYIVANIDGSITIVQLAINIQPLRYYQNFIFSIYQNQSNFKDALITSTIGFDITKFFSEQPLGRKFF